MVKSKVDDEDVVEDGFEDFDEGLVVGVWEVDFASFFVGEGYDEAVGEPFVEAFGAVVQAPFEPLDFGDFLLQAREGFLDLLDLGFGGVFLELEADDVSDAFGFHFGF